MELIAKNGFLDLTKFDFDSDSVVRLDGEWEFFWNKTPDEIQGLVKPDFIQKVPGTWGNYKIDSKPLPSFGYGCYRLTILLGESKKDLAIRVLSISPAYEIFIDGKKIGSSGNPSKENFFPKTIPQEYILDSSKSEITILVYSGNYIDLNAGIWQSIFFGSKENILKMRESAISLDLLTTGCLLIMAFYHLGLFLLRRKEYSAFYYSLFCISMTIRSLLAGEKYLLILFPDVPYEIMMKTEFSTYFLGSVLIAAFLNSVFNREFKNSFRNLVLGLSFPFFLIILFGNPKQVSESGNYFHFITLITLSLVIYSLIIAIKNNRTGAKVFFVGILVFSLTVLNDIIYNLQLINTAYISTYGFIGFIFSQAFLLATRFTTSFSESEELAISLEASNDELNVYKAELEVKVYERTMALEFEKEKSDKLLLSILPKQIAEELKIDGHVKPVHYQSVSILFTDFVGFTQIAEKMSPIDLVAKLDGFFTYFDKIIERHSIEKLKTIGDSYMCVAGIPISNETHAIDSCLAALEIIEFIKLVSISKSENFWNLRIGIHSGSVLAGVVGEKKFAYDVWGDSVNIASRMESSGSKGKINISYETYLLVKDYFECESRGKIPVKNKSEIDMYYLNRIRPEYSSDKEGKQANQRLLKLVGK